MSPRRIALLITLIASVTTSFVLTESEHPSVAYLGPHCMLWVANELDEYIDVVDTMTGETSILPTVDSGPVASAWSVTFNQDWSRAFVALQNNKIAVFDTSSYAHITDLAVRAFSVTSSSVGDFIYYADWDGDTMGRFDGSGSYGNLLTAPSGSDPAEIAVSPDGQRAIATNHNSISSGTITLTNWDLSALPAIASSPITVGTGPAPYTPIEYPWPLAFSPDGESLFVGGYLPGNVLKLDTDDLSDLTGPTLSVALPRSIAVSSDGRTVYVVSRNGTVEVLQSSDLSLVTSITVGADPTDIVLSPDDRYAFVSNGGSDSISQIRLRDNEVVATIDIDNDALSNEGPIALAIGPSNCVTENSGHRSSRRSASLDPNGGSCEAGGRHTEPWTIRFRGTSPIPGPSECTRDGYVFGGWANADTPDTIRDLPLVDDPETGTKRYQVSRNAQLIAIWHALPQPPTFFAGSTRFFCRDCTGVWLMWQDPTDNATPIVTDSNGREVCTSGVARFAGWNLCNVPEPSSGSHEFRVFARNQYGDSPPLSVTLTFPN